MKKILITGINGFVGSHLTDYLLENQVSAHIYGLIKVNARMRNLSHIGKNLIDLIEGDLTDPLSITNIVKRIKPDMIYHLGAMSWVSPSWDMPTKYFNVNAIGTINLLEAVREYSPKSKILVSCTPEEFGDVKEEDLPITEDSPIAPVNHYAASKVAQDAICQSYFYSYNLQIVRTRAFNHEGPRRDINGALASFAYQIASIEINNLEDKTIYCGNLSAKRSFTDVRDMVRAYALAMEKSTCGELYLIGSSNIYTIKESLEKLISFSICDNIKYKITDDRIRPTELNYLIGDTSKFSNLTGWTPQIPFEDTLKSILDYWRDFIKNEKY